jgi:oligoendopeptidase F
MAKDLDATEAACLRRKAQRLLIHHEKKQKRIRTEVWALKQRALDLDRRADEIDRWLRRMTRSNTQISDPESQSMDDEKDAMSQLSHTPTEVSSVSEVQA